MKDKGANRISITDKIVLIGIGIGALYWIIEAVLETFVFHKGNLIEQLFTPGLHGLWMRSLVVGIIILFSIYVQVNITREKAVEALRESEKSHRTLVESSIDAIISIDESMVVTRWNKAAEKILGYSKDETIGKTIDIIVPEKYQGSHNKGMRRFLKTGKAKIIGKTIEVEAKSKEGKNISVELSLSAVKRKGKYTFTGIIRNITERKKAEQALRESEEKFRTLFDNASDAIFIHDLDGRFLEVNEVACERLGYSREELLQMTPMDIDSPEYATLVPQRIEELRQRGHVIFATAHVRRDGRTTPIEMSSRTIEYAGEPAVLSVARDITERKKAEEALKKYSKELEQSNKLKDLFIDIMRHDLLNPVGAARGMVEMALDEEEDPDKKELLQRIFESNERIIDMIENASILARIESGEKLEFKEGDLGKILRSAAREMTSLADEKKTKIKIAAEGEFPALVNPLIHDVFSNLISNAVKYGPEDSEVVVGIEDEGTNWKVFVADTGEGVPDEDKEAIFDRFKRLQKGAVKGTGLGLAIVKMVVEAHKGRVWVEDNPDGGSVFYVEIPKIKTVS